MLENQLNIMKMREGPWAVFRTFSKAYGLAGLRVGYILCGSEEVYAGFQLARSTFNVNILAQVAACAALKDERHMQDIVSKTIVERQRIYDGLISLGCRPYPSEANFMSLVSDFPIKENKIVITIKRKTKEIIFKILRSKSIIFKIKFDKFSENIVAPISPIKKPINEETSLKNPFKNPLINPNDRRHIIIISK